VPMMMMMMVRHHRFHTLLFAEVASLYAGSSPSAWIRCEFHFGQFLPYVRVNIFCQII